MVVGDEPAGAVGTDRAPPGVRWFVPFTGVAACATGRSGEDVALCGPVAIGGEVVGGSTVVIVNDGLGVPRFCCDVCDTDAAWVVGNAAAWLPFMGIGMGADCGEAATGWFGL
jgi:hypothetical protein